MLFPFPGIKTSTPYSCVWGMDTFIHFPYPNLEWIYFVPFSFQNFGNGIIHSNSRSRTRKSHSRSPLVHRIKQKDVHYKKAMNILYEITSLKTHKMTMLLFKESKAQSQSKVIKAIQAVSGSIRQNGELAPNRARPKAGPELLAIAGAL